MRGQWTASDLLSPNETGQKLLDVNNIWAAIEILTNEYGMKVGQHLETLLCREIVKEQ